MNVTIFYVTDGIVTCKKHLPDLLHNLVIQEFRVKLDLNILVTSMPLILWLLEIKISN